MGVHKNDRLCPNYDGGYPCNPLFGPFGAFRCNLKTLGFYAANPPIGISPGWRNGRRKGLKIPREKSHVGSIPTPGTGFSAGLWASSMGWLSTAIESCTGLAIENVTLYGGDEPLVSCPVNTWT